MTRSRKKSRCKGDSNPGSSTLKAAALTTRPMRQPNREKKSERERGGKERERDSERDTDRQTDRQVDKDREEKKRYDWERGGGGW